MKRLEKYLQTLLHSLFGWLWAGILSQERSQVWSQETITCLKSSIDTLEKSVKYVQS